MKKTLAIITALFATVAVSAAADDSIDLSYSSAITNTSYNGGTYSGVQFNVQGALDAGLLVLDGDPVLDSLPSTLTLNSVDIKSRVGNSESSTVYAALLDSTGTILTLSNSTATASNGANYTFDFGGYEIDTTSTYKVALVQSIDTLTEGSILETSSSVTVQLAAWGNIYTEDQTANLGLLGTNYTVHQSKPYIPDITLHVSAATPAVPEPATATLSLLALAGLAARRRRK